MPRRKNSDIEAEWYDCFAKWDHADREAALKVLTTLHRALPRVKTTPKEDPTKVADPQGRLLS